MNKWVTWKPFDPKHLDEIELREHEAGLMAVYSKEMYLRLAEESICGTMVYDKHILCLGGIYKLNEDDCEVWIIPSVHLPKYGLHVARSTRQMLKQVEGISSIRRIQTVAIDDQLHARWLTFLGFTDEGPEELELQTDKKYRRWAKVIK